MDLDRHTEFAFVYCLHLTFYLQLQRDNEAVFPALRRQVLWICPEYYLKLNPEEFMDFLFVYLFLFCLYENVFFQKNILYKKILKCE